jgi:adenylate cyclase
VVKGKTQPVAVFEILDYHTDETFPQLMDVLNHFRDGLEKYRKRQFGPAIDAFRRALAVNPADALCDVYIARAEHLRENPPGDDWNGVWTMESK